MGHAVQHGRCSDGVSQVRYRLLAHELRDAGTRVGVQATWLDDDFSECGFDCEVAGDAGYVWTDKYGKRFMDETRSYQHGYGRDALFYNDSPDGMAAPAVLAGCRREHAAVYGNERQRLGTSSAAPALPTAPKSCFPGLDGQSRHCRGTCFSDGRRSDDPAGECGRAFGPDDEFGRAAERSALSGTLYAVQLSPSW
ncbi:MAG: hypothetical protein ACLSVD_09230 [Eggerthellaceae bacterium]